MILKSNVPQLGLDLHELMNASNEAIQFIQTFIDAERILTLTPTQENSLLSDLTALAVAIKEAFDAAQATFVATS